MSVPYRYRQVNCVASALVVGFMVGWQPLANAIESSDFSVDAGLRWEDNLSLSPESRDKVSDLTTHFDVAGNFALVDTDVDQFSFGVNAHYDHVSDTRDLSNYGAQLSLIYQRNFGTDFTAPWISFGADGQLLEYKDSDIRDGYIVNTTATIGRQLNPKIGISGGYRFFLRRSTEDNPDMQPANWWPDEVFDLERHNIFAHVNYAANAKTTIYADLNYFDGDVAASGRSFNNGKDFPRAWDRAFGDGYLAWKIDATGFNGKIGMVHGFSEQLSIDVFAEFLSASGESNNDYDNTIFQALLTYGF